MKIIELSKVLDGYQDIDQKLLEPMIYEHSEDFDIYKIEKDFLLTIILIYLGKNNPELIFKGGTCLNKIYFEYYRLSEDLDFVVINSLTRSKRKNILEEYKQFFKSDIFIYIGLTLSEKRTKFDEDNQGCFEFLYNSFIDDSPQTIKIDIRIEPSILCSPIQKNIGSIFNDPIYRTKFFKDHTINVMDLDEMFAEKTRAALTRDPSAIRDFFDIWYAKEKKGFDFEKIRPMIYQKVSDLPYIIDNSYDILKQQIKTELDPVLTIQDRELFDLDEIYKFILTFKNPNA